MTRLSIIDGHFVPHPSGFTRLPADIPSDLATSAVPAVECFEIGWTQEDALAVVESLVGSSIAIYAVDVHVDDGWYGGAIVSNRTAGQTWSDYARESQRRAAQAILQYSSPKTVRFALEDRRALYFVLAFCTQPHNDAVGDGCSRRKKSPPGFKLWRFWWEE